MTSRTSIIALLLLLFAAAFLRLWRIGEFTEFLGDQGRTGIIIYEALREGSLPLVGPPVLTGQFLGPFYYYFIGLPFIVGRFNPLIPSIAMALAGVLSVYLLFRLASRLWGFWIGLSVASLYAVSPSIVRADRTIWEPTIIPLFVLLFLTCVQKIFVDRRFWSFALMGVIVGILVQLHYPNIFFIGLSILFFFVVLFTKRKKESCGRMVLWFFLGMGGFILLLSPFLWYEAKHSWIDLRELAFILLTGGGPSGASMPFFSRVIDLSSRLFGTMLLHASGWFFWVIQLVVLLMLFFRPNFWSMFFGVWYVGGVFALSLYHGTVFDHYLNFLLPLPFLLFGHFLSKIQRLPARYVWIGVIVVLVILNIQAADVFSIGNNDISRTQKLTKEMIKLANGQPFSFTLTSSRSFSDLHYRYFFTLAHRMPQSITQKNYDTLFLVCEKLPCPTVDDMKTQVAVHVLCYEAHCSGEYPRINISDWKLLLTRDIESSRIYQYQKHESFF